MCHNPTLWLLRQYTPVPYNTNLDAGLGCGRFCIIKDDLRCSTKLCWKFLDGDPPSRTSTSMILLWYESAWISAKLWHCISPNPESLNCFGHFSVDSSDKPPFRVRSFPSAECSRVNHQCNSRNVNPTWCNIRCNQHTWRSCANDRVGHPRKNWNLKMNNPNNFETENWE